MRGDYKTRRDGTEYQEWRYDTEELRRDVLRFRKTPEEARKRIEDLRRLLGRLLDPKLTDARRVGIVNLLRQRLIGAYTEIEDLAPLSKIACGAVDPETLRFIEPDALALHSTSSVAKPRG